MVAPFGAESQVSFGEIVAGFTRDSAQRALTSQPEPTPAASQVASPAPKSNLHGQRKTDVWNSFRVQGGFCPRLMCRSLLSEIATISTRTSFRAESNCRRPNSTRRTTQCSTTTSAIERCRSRTALSRFLPRVANATVMSRQQ